MASQLPRTAVDLFCGAAAGWTLGLHWAGVTVVAGCEADPARAAAWRARWGRYVHHDIKTMGPHNTSSPWLLCGSPPCKGISEVNHKGNGVDDDGLFFEAIRLGAALRESDGGPDWLALENVSRLRTRGADRVLAAMEAAGFEPLEPIVVGSAEAGKDHDRQRVFLIASNPAGREGRPARQPRATLGCAAARRHDIAGPEDRRARLAHLGPEALSCHLRAYDGVSDRVADFARGAFGDAVDPLLPNLIARGLIAWEEGDRRSAV